jgi:hypothetical protein
MIPYYSCKYRWDRWYKQNFQLQFRKCQRCKERTMNLQLSLNTNRLHSSCTNSNLLTSRSQQSSSNTLSNQSTTDTVHLGN